MALSQKIGNGPQQVIDGYHVSGALTPNGGLQGTAKVTTHDRMDAADRPLPFNLDDGGKLTRVNLQVFDADRSYTFQAIDLDHFESAGDNARRGRRWTFRYAHTPDQPRAVNTTLIHKGTVTPMTGPVGDDYTYGLEAFPQHLLGFRARLGAYDGVVMEFAAVRNAKNSFLEAVLRLNNAIAAGQTMPPLTIRFAQGNIVIDDAKLNRLYVEESCGTLLQTRRLGLAAFLEAGAGPELIRPPVDEDSPADLLSRWLDHRYIPPVLSHTVERLVVVFNPGYYSNLALR